MTTDKPEPMMAVEEAIAACRAMGLQQAAALIRSLDERARKAEALMNEHIRAANACAEIVQEQDVQIKQQAEEIERLRTGVESFRDRAGKHDGDHYQEAPGFPGGMAHGCAQCEMSYIAAEAALDELVKR